MRLVVYVAFLSLFSLSTGKLSHRIWFVTKDATNVTIESGVVLLLDEILEHAW